MIIFIVDYSVEYFLCEKCLSGFPKDGVLKYLVLSTTQIYSVYFHRGVKKPENPYIKDAGIRENFTVFFFFFLEKFVGMHNV